MEGRRGRRVEREMVDIHRRTDGEQRREGSMATKWEGESVESVVDGREKRERRSQFMVGHGSVRRDN